ncbi:MAG: haloacid dehalogenase-like hydrolase [Firmicutes bacterium]|nr:haloacid dehalogenase-like hydrolase [Bacillota bacterium]
MEQNIIALIWDFDKTLVDGYMQTPIFERYQIKEAKFWQEIKRLEQEYEQQKVRVNKDIIYLNHFLTCVDQGIFPGLNNKVLRELGQKLRFYPGVPDIFKIIKDHIAKNEKYQAFNIQVEHYIVSTGLAEMIRGSAVAAHVDGIWGCEFIETPIKSTLQIKEYKRGNCTPAISTEIQQVGYALDNTSKTRVIFKINKGVNKYPEIDVNSKMAAADRRVPFENMIYIADGPTDVPAFSLLKNNGGRTFAVFPRGDAKRFRQVDQLRVDGRIDMFGEADYTKGTITYMWLLEHTRQIADRIRSAKLEKIKMSVSEPPQHIID